MRLEDEFNPELPPPELLANVGETVLDVVDVETATRARVVTVWLTVLPSLTATTVDVTCWLWLMTDSDKTTREESDRVETIFREISLSVEDPDADGSEEGDDVICDRGFVCDDPCDGSIVSDDCVGGIVEEPELTAVAEEGIVDGAADGAAFVEAAALLAGGVLDVGLEELGIIPVPIGTFCCRLWRAISMWLVPRARGSTAVSSKSCEKIKESNMSRF